MIFTGHALERIFQRKPDDLTPEAFRELILRKIGEEDGTWGLISHPDHGEGRSCFTFSYRNLMYDVITASDKGIVLTVIKTSKGRQVRLKRSRKSRAQQETEAKPNYPDRLIVGMAITGGRIKAG